MVASWYTEATAAVASQGTATYSNTFMYFNNPEDGARYTKGWFKVVPGYYLQKSKYEDGSEYWYYADGDGQIYSNEIKTIKGKKYAFDNYGRMISGLVFLEMANGTTSNEIQNKLADDDDLHPYDTEDNFDQFVKDFATEINDHTIRSYYFGGSDDGAMKTGKQTVTIDGESFTFKFKTGSNLKGSGLVGEDDDKLYMAGKQVKADKDDKYTVYKYDKTNNSVTEMTTTDFIATCTDGGKHDDDKEETVYTVTTTNTDSVKYYLVNTSGTILKNKTNAKDADDYKFSVSKRQITKVVLED